MNPPPSSCRVTDMSTEELDYKQLRKTDPEAARQAVIRFLEASNHNVSRTASFFGINRSVVYDIISKAEEGDLEDRPRVPKYQPTRTPQDIEDRVIKVKAKTQLGAQRLSRYLKEREGLSIPVGTLRHIIRRRRGKN